MKIYQKIDEYTPVNNPVVTVGTFDGVHVGHRKIIERMREVADQLNGETVLLTFYPHPRLVIHADSKNLKFLTTQEHKIQLLEKAGIDHLIIIPFTREFSKITAIQFIKTYIVDKIRVKKLIIGFDHHFGKNRIGDFSISYDLSKKYHFEIEKIPSQDVNNLAVSSTKIRRALIEGRIKIANSLLGYEYSISGKVIKGKNIGKNIGFPTANVLIEDYYKLIVANGVYACRIGYKGMIHLGMSNIGFRPTVSGKENLNIEVHIFDFDENIYDKEITIYFVDRLRDEMKFQNMEELKEQLTTDKKDAKKILKY